MAAVVYPRRAISTATTITVSGLPAWLPAAGSWGAVSLNSAYSIRGDFPPRFPSTRSFDSLWNDFSGAVWNPYIGTYGAMLFHGGGHASNDAMLDNAVYMWRADSRQWSRLTDPTYPGELTAPDWSIPKNPPYVSDLLNTYGELATNVPASNHSRNLPCILPPAHGGGTMGSFVIPYLGAIHTGDAGGSSQVHRLDCSAAISSGSASGYLHWSRLGPLSTVNKRGWSGCIDSTRGRVYVSNDGSPSVYELTRLDVASLTWSTVTPSGWIASGFYSKPIQYAAEHDMLIVMKQDFAIAVMNAGASPLVLIPCTASGSPPTGGAPTGGEGGGFVWCPDLGANGAVVHYNYVTHEVKACYAPANPLSGSGWAWSTLSASNTPSGRGDAQHWYCRFQYSEALKSFFLCSMPNDSYGGIVCFRPSEIP